MDSSPSLSATDQETRDAINKAENCIKTSHTVERDGASPWRLLRSIRSPESLAMDGFENTESFTDLDLRMAIRSLNSVRTDLRSISIPDRKSEISRMDRWLSVDQMERCFLCDICGTLLNNPYASIVCLHVYCRSCICEKLSDDEEAENVCPVIGCGFESLDGFRSTHLGPDPLNPKTGKIKKDRILSALTQKLFGEEIQISVTESSTASQATDEDDITSENQSSVADKATCVPSINVDTSLVSDDGLMQFIHLAGEKTFQRYARAVPETQVLREQHQDFNTLYMTVAVFCSNSGGDVGDEKLSHNYFYLPSKMTLSNFAGHLRHKFGLYEALYSCCGVPIDDASMTLMDIYDDYWLPYVQAQEREVFTLHYMIHGP